MGRADEWEEELNRGAKESDPRIEVMTHRGGVVQDEETHPVLVCCLACKYKFIVHTAQVRPNVRGCRKCNSPYLEFLEVEIDVPEVEGVSDMPEAGQAQTMPPPGERL